MASEAQIGANRRNARHSTGPRTKDGKIRSKMNALRHGLYAAQLVAMGESDGDLTCLLTELRAALEPRDAYEDLLVRRVAQASWRLDRLAKLEAALLDGEAGRETRRRGATAEDVWPLALVPLGRHEAGLDRAMQRAMRLLADHRAARRHAVAPTQ